MSYKKPLICFNCKSIILTLSISDIKKFNGLNFRCECCGHENKLSEKFFTKGTNINDPYANIFSIDKVLINNTSKI